jgi:hypothetical protein
MNGMEKKKSFKAYSLLSDWPTELRLRSLHVVSPAVERWTKDVHDHAQAVL